MKKKNYAVKTEFFFFDIINELFVKNHDSTNILHLEIIRDIFVSVLYISSRSVRFKL